MFRPITYKIVEESKRFVFVGAALLLKVAENSSSNCHDCEEEERSFHQTLQYHKTLLEDYKEKWNWHNVNSRIPTVSWPQNIPEEKEISSLQFDYKFCKSLNSSYCQDLSFRIASFLLMQPDLGTQKKGLEMVQELAEKDNPDAMCALATCFNDGRAGVEINPKVATSWWMTACEKHEHIQSLYEMGVAFYTGEGVPENEEVAVEYFKRAADSGHSGACYMLGDCLLDGVGVERDRSEALEWLITSAELGHRGARSRVLAVLEMDPNKCEDYHGFTDSSRQSLATAWTNGKLSSSIKAVSADKSHINPFDHGKTRDGLEMQYSNRPVNIERRYTIGGGARNPKVLKRRETIVKESRQGDLG